jgi:hypothetical protein
MSTLRIGITIGLHHEAETLWNNGIKQNAAFLAEALRHCPQVARVVLVNTTAVAITAALPWDQVRHPTLSFETAKDDLDVLIELGGQIDAAQTEYLKQRNVRLVSYCCGFEYVHAMESVLFRKPAWATRCSSISATTTSGSFRRSRISAGHISRYCAGSPAGSCRLSGVRCFWMSASKLCRTQVSTSRTTVRGA